MRIFLVGGTGFLGSAVAEELINRGHEVKAIALETVSHKAELPPEMEIEFKNYLDFTDDEIRKCFSGCEGFIFAAGVDERTDEPSPVYEYFNTYNVRPLERFLRIAKECGVRHTVICGSYFSFFDKKWPHLELTYWHPYIRSQREQEKMALSFAGDNFNVAILELPNIFGIQTGCRPVWAKLVKTLRKMPGITIYPNGGSTMITRKQAAQAIVGALEKTRGGKCWPIGCYNMPWKDFLEIVHKNMKIHGRPVISIPAWMINLKMNMIEKKYRQRERDNHIKGGIFMPKFPVLQSAECYIDRTHGCIPLGVEDDDIVDAIGQSICYAAEECYNEA